MYPFFLRSLILTSSKVGMVLFPEFEMLDAFGPLEMFAALFHVQEKIELITIGCTADTTDEEVQATNAQVPDALKSERGLSQMFIRASQGPLVVTDCSLGDCPELDVLLIPGGLGTRMQVGNKVLIDFIRDRAEKATMVCSICTGSVLLAEAGLLDGKKATTNKRAFNWAKTGWDKVLWQESARWQRDGKFITSSGVSAGTDLALFAISLMFSKETAKKVATVTEYKWDEDPSNDPFSESIPNPAAVPPPPPRAPSLSTIPSNDMEEGEEDGTFGGEEDGTCGVIEITEPSDQLDDVADDDLISLDDSASIDASLKLVRTAVDQRMCMTDE
jgi:putative intracellular protease/amidase